MPSINVKLSDEDFETASNCKPEGYTWKRFILSSCWIMGRLSDKNTPRTEWGKEWTFDTPVQIEKPCHKTGYCPYGQTVEMFPFQTPRNHLSCKTFGHTCPAYYLAEPITERQRPP